MQNYSSTILVFLAFLTMGCQYFKDKEDKRKKTPIARVGINYLYQNDLEASLPQQLTEKDSTAIAESIVEEWLVQKLMEEKALDFLPQKKIESIERKVINYKSSLYAFQYEQELLNQKMDNEVTEEEVQNYYNANPEALKVTEPIIHVKYFVLKKEDEVQKSLKAWLIQEEDFSEDQINEWASNYASQYNVEGKWISLDKLVRIFSKTVKKNDFLEKEKLIEAEDEQYYYLAWVENFKKRGKNPLGYQPDKLKRIIINQKKETYLKEVKNKLLNEGHDKKLVERY